MNHSLSHEECIGCSKNGMLVHDIGIFDEKQGLTAKMHMDKKREGWVGIPHGGIGMGAIMEMISFHKNYPSDADELYPLQVNFRMGGASARVGDTVMLHTWPTDKGAQGAISVNGAVHPYISADISYGQDNEDLWKSFQAYVPATIDEMRAPAMDVPNYRDCFVCGLERREPGLRRRFQVIDRNGQALAVAPVGFSESDRDEFFWCRRGDRVHPLALLSLLDETMGWGGFLLSGHGGVSVRFSFLFKRDIRINEKFVAFGRGEQVKGNIDKRMMFWSSGGICAVKEDGKLDMIAASSGQFLAVSELTDQMKTHLFPAELTRKVFDIAGQKESIQ